MKVFVYKNLHATRKNSGITVYSVKALDGPDKGKVVARSSHVLLEDVRPKVSQAGRARVLRENRKNVHAGLVGELRSLEAMPFHGQSITYNPYKYDGFVMSAWDTVEYRGSELAYLTESGVKVIEPKG
jgi:hypothetical protein